MPDFLLPHRPAREPDEQLLDMILDGQSLPLDAPRDALDLAEVLADLVGPAEPGVLTGEAAALSAFARTAPPAGVSRRPVLRRPPLRAALGAALVAVTAGLGGGVAAYADVLPGPAQDFAHDMIGAPPAHPATHAKPRPGKVKHRTGAEHPVKPVKASTPPKPPKPPRPAPLRPPKAGVDPGSKAKVPQR